MARQTSVQVTPPELTSFLLLESQRSSDNSDSVWTFNLATQWIDGINSISFRKLMYDQKQ